MVALVAAKLVHPPIACSQEFSYCDCYVYREHVFSLSWEAFACFLALCLDLLWFNLHALIK